MRCLICCKCVRETDVIVSQPPATAGSTTVEDGHDKAAVQLDDKTPSLIVEDQIQQQQQQRKLEKATSLRSLYYFDAESQEAESEVAEDEQAYDVEAFFFDAMDTAAAAEEVLLSGPHNGDNTFVVKYENIVEDGLLLAPCHRLSAESSIIAAPLCGKRPRSAARSSEEWGFPGSLTPFQLDAYQHFRTEVKRKGGVYEEMVYCYKEIEPEPYALCRFLRWANFHVEKVFRYMDEHVERWNEAKKHNFYPSAGVGSAPLSVLLTQFPSVYTGFAREGFPVCYFHSSNLSVEGIDCVTDVERLPNFIWYTMIHDIKRIYAEAMSRHPTLGRMEQITVMNLDGLSPNLMTPRTYAVSQQADGVAQAFPEMLYKLIIINAPRFFTYLWNSFKYVLDPNTTKRIEIYASAEKGIERLKELIDESELPSDYGGLAMSTSDAILREGRKGPVPLRQIVELMRVTKRREGTFEFELQRDELIALEIYTRSKSCTEFSLLNDQEEVVKEITIEQADEGPFRVRFVQAIRGPGEFSVVGRHAQGSTSTEYFLVVGEVFPAEDAKATVTKANGDSSTIMQ